MTAMCEQKLTKQGNESERSGITIKYVPDGTHEAHVALVLRDAHSMPRFWCLQTRFNGWSLTMTILTVSSPVYFVVDESEFLSEGPNGDDRFVNSWQVMSESIGKAKFDAGSRSESICAWIVDARVVTVPTKKRTVS